jgi:hypothetical protein
MLVFMSLSSKRCERLGDYHMNFYHDRQRLHRFCAPNLEAGGDIQCPENLLRPVVKPFDVTNA